jgi:rhamnosyltransferase
VIRTKNESQYIGEVLKRLGEQTYGGRTEVVLVDSGSSDNTVAIANRFGCRIIHLKPEEFSFGRALNRGIMQAEGDIIIFLSGHSVPVGTDYFDQMVRPLTERGIAATFGRDVPRPDACPSQARDILSHFPEAGLDGNKFSNANAAVRKKIWERVQFNEHLTACEDLLWAQKVMGLGYGIIYVPRASVYHSHTASPFYIFRRYLRERSSVKKMLDLPGPAIKDIFKNSYWHIKCDFRFVKERSYGFRWYFHIPLYRLSQEIGLYIGSKLEEQGRRSVG